MNNELRIYSNRYTPISDSMVFALNESNKFTVEGYGGMILTGIYNIIFDTSNTILRGTNALLRKFDFVGDWVDELVANDKIAKTLYKKSKSYRSHLDDRMYTNDMNKMIITMTGLNAHGVELAKFISVTSQGISKDAHSIFDNCESLLGKFIHSVDVRKTTTINPVDYDALKFITESRENLSNMFSDDMRDQVPMSEVYRNYTDVKETIQLCEDNSNEYLTYNMLYSYIKRVKKISEKVNYLVSMIEGGELTYSKEALTAVMNSTDYAAEYVTMAGTFYYLNMRLSESLIDICTKVTK